MRSRADYTIGKKKVNVVKEFALNFINIGIIQYQFVYIIQVKRSVIVFLQHLFIFFLTVYGGYITIGMQMKFGGVAHLGEQTAR